MLTQERYHIILNQLNQQGAVTVTELSERLEASESTVRRDLNALAKAGKLQKVFGGATSVTRTSGVDETRVSSRELTMREEKQRIARYAASLVEDGDFVYIDSGTTTGALVDYLTNDRATYVTNGVAIAHKLLHSGLTVYLIGGRIKPVTEAIVGAEGVRSLEGYHFTKAFMGTNGIDLDAGFTTPDIEEARVKERAVRQSFMTFILADSTKFRRVYPAAFARLNDCCIITDRLPDNRFSEHTTIKEVTA